MSKWTKLRDQAREYANDAAKKIEKEFNLKDNFERAKEDLSSFSDALKEDLKSVAYKVNKKLNLSENFEQATTGPVATSLKRDLKNLFNGKNSENESTVTTDKSIPMDKFILYVAQKSAEKADQEANDHQVVSMEAGRIFTEEMESIGLVSNDDSE